MPDSNIHHFNTDATVAVRLSLLEQSMENTESVLKTIHDDSKSHREIHNRETREIYTAMENLRKELKTDLSALKDDLNNRIDEKTTALETNLNGKIDKQTIDLKKEIDEQSEILKNLDKKLDDVEKWRWIVIGAAMAIGFLISNVDKILKVFLTS